MQTTTHRIDWCISLYTNSSYHYSVRSSFLLQNVAMLLQHRLVVTASAHSKLQERLNGLIQTIELELRGWQYLTLQIAAVARMLANGIEQRSQLSNVVETASSCSHSVVHSYSAGAASMVAVWKCATRMHCLALA